MPEQLLTTTQAAQVLQVAPHTLRRWVREGVVPAARFGRRHLRFDPNDLRVPDLRPAPPAVGSYPEKRTD